MTTTDLSLMSDALSRSISAENPQGEPGQGGRATSGTGQRAARDLGPGWKISPSIVIDPGGHAVLGEITGPGVLRHMWITTAPKSWRQMLLRIDWEDGSHPAVLVPLGDFFGQGWGEFAALSSSFVTVAPFGGLNCYWPMPFRHKASVSLHNLADEPATVYYQLDYTLEPVPDHAGYLHAEWNRSSPVGKGETHTVLRGATGRGQYVGTYLAVGVNHPGWWGEREMKFYLDGDEDAPTICGTGTEDYFGGAWNFDVHGHGYTAYSSPYLGLHQVSRPDGLYASQQRFGMYRWHGPDPIRFSESLRVTLQDLGWRPDGRYLLRRDDLASTAWWYQDRPDGSETGAPTLEDMEVGSRP